jgi:uncharacterized protein
MKTQSPSSFVSPISPVSSRWAAAGAALALGAVAGAWLLAAGAAAPLAPLAPVANAQGSVPGEPAQTISVSGEGEATAAPDVAYLTLAVQTEAPTAREAIDRNSTAMAAVIDALKRLGIQDRHLRTSGISLNPVRVRPRPDETQPPPITGYQATNSLSVTVEPVARAGEAIDVAVSAGANVAGGIRFAIQDDAALRRQALDAAVRNARTTADAMAAAAGVRVTGVRSMSDESGGAVPVPRAEVQALGAADRSVAPPVQPGELTVRARVRVVFTFG